MATTSDIKGNGAGDVKYRIELVEKTCAILEAFSRERTELTLKDVVEQTGQTSSGAFRILANLVRLEMLEHTDAGRYRIAPKLFRIGSLAISDVRRVALPWMTGVRDAIDYTTNLILRDGDSAVLVEYIESVRPFRMAAVVGSRDPLHCTAAGKTMLAFADSAEREAAIQRLELTSYTPTTITTRAALRREILEVRRDVFAVDRGEYEAHARCIAAPVFDRREQAIGAVSVSGSEALLDHPEDVVGILQDAARGISGDLGFVAEYPSAAADDGVTQSLR